MINTLLYRNAHIPVFPFAPNVVHNRREGFVTDEEDLETVALQIQKKRFYVDVKKNWRGRFMKIAEVSTDGRKARILLTMAAADDLNNKLKDLINVYNEIVKKENGITGVDLQEVKTDDPNSDGLIKSHTINHPYRRYYLDLKKNVRGYFLRLTMLSTTARVKLAVPAQGIEELHKTMSTLLKRWWNRSPSSEMRGLNLPEPKALRIDNKTLYFDSSSNRYGIFLRISQVWTSSRTAIIIPGRSLNQFRDIINELAEHLSTSNIDDKNDGAKETEAAVEDIPVNVENKIDDRNDGAKETEVAVEDHLDISENGIFP